MKLPKNQQGEMAVGVGGVKKKKKRKREKEANKTIGSEERMKRESEKRNYNKQQGN
jgi:hypothetical protein